MDPAKVLQIDRINGAMSNDVFKLSLKNDKKNLQATNDPDAMLLKIYRNEGIGTGLLESTWMRHLATISLSPTVYLDFSNGRLEEFLQGKTLSTDGMKQSIISDTIATLMRKLHGETFYLKELTITQHYNQQDFNYWHVICRSKKKAMRYMNFFDDYSNGEICLWDKVKRELTKSAFKNCFKQIQVATLKLDEKFKERETFIHLDLQPGNIMNIGGDLENEGPCLRFIDYEYANFGPYLLDIANHFCEWAFTYVEDLESGSGMHLSYNKANYPGRLDMERFLTAYHLEACSSETLEENIQAVQFYMLVSDLKWIFWSVEKYVQFTESTSSSSGTTSTDEDDTSNGAAVYLELCLYKLQHFQEKFSEYIVYGN